MFRFEDMLEHPLGITGRIHGLAGFDLSVCRKLRFKAKPHSRSNRFNCSNLEEGRHNRMNHQEACQFPEPLIIFSQEGRPDLDEASTNLEATEVVRQVFSYG
jgi:hypothetical protein